MASHVTFKNEPTFWGMRIPRDTAHVESARLYDLNLNEYFGPVLLWREEGTNKLTQKIDIESGKQAQLYVFAKDRYAEDFFVMSGSSLVSELPEHLTKISRDRSEFAIHLSDRMGRKYKYKIVVRNSDQSVGISFRMTLANRRQLIAEGICTIFGAFRFRR